jgi:hypothetical protein
MIIIRPDDKNFITDNLENAEDLLRSEDVNDLLDALYDFNDIKCFDDKECKSSYVQNIQSIYDHIYSDNKLQHINTINDPVQTVMGGF